MTCDLPNAELDAWIAVNVMGWGAAYRPGWDFRPTTSIADCWLAQEQVRELGKEKEWLAWAYQNALNELLNTKQQSDSDWDLALIYATPRSRCEAIWAAMREGT
jgi:hypothetical protein